MLFLLFALIRVQYLAFYSSFDFSSWIIISLCDDWRSMIRTALPYRPSRISTRQAAATSSFVGLALEKDHLEKAWSTELPKILVIDRRTVSRRVNVT